MAELEARHLQPWKRRAIEEANLFNPAFCATLVTKSVGDYNKKTGRSMPFALAFLVLPIIMHRETRQALPGSTVTALLPWLQEHKDYLANFPSRMRRLKPFGQEAIMFGIAHGTLSLAEDGGLLLGSRKVATTAKKTDLFTSEVRECVDRAAFLGRWFSAAGTSATILAGWGVAL